MVNRRLDLVWRDEPLRDGIDAPVNRERNARPSYAVMTSRDGARVAIACVADARHAARIAPFVLGSVLGGVAMIPSAPGVWTIATQAPATGEARVVTAPLPRERVFSSGALLAALRLDAMEVGDRARALWGMLRLPQRHPAIAVLWDRSAATGYAWRGSARESLFEDLCVRVSPFHRPSRIQAAVGGLSPSERRALARGLAFARRVDRLMLGGAMADWARFALATDALPLEFAAEASGLAFIEVERRRELVRRAFALASREPVRILALGQDVIDAYVDLDGILPEGFGHVRSFSYSHVAASRPSSAGRRFFSIDGRDGVIRLGFVATFDENVARDLFDKGGFEDRTIGDLSVMIPSCGDVILLSEGGMSEEGIAAQRAWNNQVAPRRRGPGGQVAAYRGKRVDSRRGAGAFDAVAISGGSWKRSRGWPHAGFESEFSEDAFPVGVDPWKDDA